MSYINFSELSLMASFKKLASFLGYRKDRPNRGALQSISPTTKTADYPRTHIDDYQHILLPHFRRQAKESLVIEAMLGKGPKIYTDRRIKERAAQIRSNIDHFVRQVHGETPQGVPMPYDIPIHLGDGEDFNPKRAVLPHSMIRKLWYI